MRRAVNYNVVQWCVQLCYKVDTKFREIPSEDGGGGTINKLTGTNTHKHES